ncbi:MAG: bifunctional precorrin-2 dehydrogenase/sirohydrochlorin ferrochelatase, partial [Nitrosopumilaceae archaeon]
KKINSLLTQDCKILVLTDKTNTQIKNYVLKKKIKFKKIKLENANFLSDHKPYLVMATTDDKSLNRKIVNRAIKMNCLAYASDDPKVSDFSHPSVINIEDTIQVAISTGGKSPVMARKIKNEAEKIFKKIVNKDDIHQIKIQEIARKAAKGKISSQKERKKFLYTVLNDKRIKQLIKDDEPQKAQKRAMLMLEEWK